MSKNTTVPAYLVLVSQLLETCDRLGLAPLRAGTTSTLPENNGWCFLRFGSDDAPSILISKSVAKVAVHSHIDLSDMACWVELTKYNGRVIGHIDASLADWDTIVARLPDASKRPIKRASKVASTTADMTEFLAKLQTLGQAKTPASPATPEATVVAPVVAEPETLEESEEEMFDQE